MSRKVLVRWLAAGLAVLLVIVILVVVLVVNPGGKRPEKPRARDLPDTKGDGRQVSTNEREPEVEIKTEEELAELLVTELASEQAPEV
jgi:hypothetical protein